MSSDHRASTPKTTSDASRRARHPPAARPLGHPVHHRARSCPGRRALTPRVCRAVPRLPGDGLIESAAGCSLREGTIPNRPHRTIGLMCCKAVLTVIWKVRWPIRTCLVLMICRRVLGPVHEIQPRPSTRPRRRSAPPAWPRRLCSRAVRLCLDVPRRRPSLDSAVTWGR